MRVVDLGTIGFSEALALQEPAVEEVLAGGEERIFVLEHRPVVTFGRHGGEAFLLETPDQLRARGVDVAKASRGGSVTCHFPGQAVIYPVMRLSGRPGGLKRFFSDLEQAAIDVLAGLGIEAGRSEGRPGVWTGPRKIASVGVGVRRWVSYHGLALNVGPDISLFNVITACGLPGVEMTSAALELARAGLPAERADIGSVKHELVQAFLRLARG
ncbi:lipoyl(octanoyl) transferase LipB [Fundidesulfovibrio soli]|uniref:lipoyl(octanoyl) transferase LipB n=1 Tax=Fundidesulfovibrio soli TaxID=2922716 RepID=UPI001FB036DB|nr:lipoyl(octanoyl) transferase LipB [Fundidesulfovibrio soli]